MIIDVKYGKDGVQKADIPDENYVGTFYPKDVECGDPDKVKGDSIDGRIVPRPNAALRPYECPEVLYELTLSEVAYLYHYGRTMALR